MSDLEYTRHARERMRQYGLTEEDIGAVVADPERCDWDERGNPVLVGRVAGRGVVVVLVRGGYPRRVKTVWTLGRRRA